MKNPHLLRIPAGIPQRRKFIPWVLVGLALTSLAMILAWGNTCLLDLSVPPETQFALAAPFGLVLLFFWIRAPNPRIRVGLRWLTAPIFFLVFTALGIVIVRGWTVGVSRMLASQPTTIELTVVSVEYPSGRRTRCHHVLNVRHRGEDERLCVEGLLDRDRHVEGRILAKGLSSPLGLHVQAIEVP